MKSGQELGNGQSRKTEWHGQRPNRLCVPRTGSPVGHESVLSTGLYGKKVPVSYPRTANLLKARTGGLSILVSPAPETSQMPNKYVLNERAKA